MDWGRLASVVRTFITDTFDAVMPPHVHTLRTRARRPIDIPHRVCRHELLDVSVTTLMEYRVPAVQDLIRSLKYDGNAHAALLCADILADFLREEVATLRSFSPRPIVIVPIPLHPARERSRGFNQIMRILDKLPAAFKEGRDARVATGILMRTRDTPHQTALSRAHRMANVHEAFAVSNTEAVRGMRVFVIDDVTTTGATLASAHAALKKAGAEVLLVALARA